jgi:hypothetical protein
MTQECPVPSEETLLPQKPLGSHGNPLVMGWGPFGESLGHQLAHSR